MELKLYLSLLLLTSSSSETKRLKSSSAKELQIINGQYAKNLQFPFFASLFIYKEEHLGPDICGASWISPNWLLTAAHCCRDAKKIELGVNSIKLDYFGKENTQRVTARGCLKHPGYTRGSNLNDIALVKVDQPPHGVKTIQLPPKNAASQLYAKASVFAVGFGRTDSGSYRNSNDLKFAQMRVLSAEECENLFGMGSLVLCAQGLEGTHVNVCDGDSGGALAARGRRGKWTIVGVVSFNVEETCTQYASGFTRVEPFVDWIHQIMSQYG